jgi:mannitol-1-phosphate 5-dehydrogenase
MTRKAVQFGAGNIGRGFIAQLFHESGFEVVFVDVVPEVLQALNARHDYTIHIVGPGAQDVPIRNVRAVDGRDQAAVATEIAEAEIVCTAVGAGALPHIAPNLAAGLRLRDEQRGGPLNVLICENLHNADAHLRALVAGALPAEDRDAMLAKTGFVQAVVSRMVPLQTAEDNGGDLLAIRVEAYKRLPVDAGAVVGQLPKIAGVEPVSNFAAHEERKLYAHNCAHATLGYLGYHKGIEYGYQALAEPEIRLILDQVLDETGTALIRKHGFDPVEYAAYSADLLTRFENEELGDTCFRLARDPVRKLAPGDRLMGAARLCEDQGVEPVALARVIGHALRFYSADDKTSMELQDGITRHGIDAALELICGIRDLSSPLAMSIKAAYAEAGPR